MKVEEKHGNEYENRRKEFRQAAPGTPNKLFQSYVNPYKPVTS